MDCSVKSCSCCNMRAAPDALLIQHPIAPRLVTGRGLAAVSCNTGCSTQRATAAATLGRQLKCCRCSFPHNSCIDKGAGISCTELRPTNYSKKVAAAAAAHQKCCRCSHPAVSAKITELGLAADSCSTRTAA